MVMINANECRADGGEGRKGEENLSVIHERINNVSGRKMFCKQLRIKVSTLSFSHFPSPKPAQLASGTVVRHI